MKYEVREDGVILYNGEPMHCANCERVLTKEDLQEPLPEHYTDDDFYFYEDSVGKKYCHRDDCGMDLHECRHCGEVFHYSHMMYLESVDDYVCNDCLESNYRYCDICENYYPRSCVQYMYVYGRGGVMVCDGCMDDMYTCQDCGDLVDSDDVEWVDEIPYCPNCAEQHDDGGSIHDYHYTDEPGYGMPFLGEEKRHEKVLIGVELEIESRNGCSYNQNCDDSDAIREKIGTDYVVSCHDGSLDDGFELVSCPANIEHHTKTLHWKDGLKEALDRYYRSHDGGHCGLHTHIDRQYFGAIPKDDVEGRFFIILRNNMDWIKTFSRRFNYGYCKINGYENRSDGSEDTLGKFTYPPDKVWLQGKKQTERHMALNFYNCDTIEVRIYRGTLKYQTFLASLQLSAIWAYLVKYNSNDGCVRIRLNDFVSTALQLGYTEFIAYLRERGITNDNNTGF